MYKVVDRYEEQVDIEQEEGDHLALSGTPKTQNKTLTVIEFTNISEKYQGMSKCAKGFNLYVNWYYIIMKVNIIIFVWVIQVYK